MKKMVSLLVGMGFLCLGGAVVDAEDLSKNRNQNRAVQSTSQVTKPKTYQLVILSKTTTGQVLEKRTETLAANQKITRSAKAFANYTLKSPNTQSIMMSQNQTMIFVYQKKASPVVQKKTPVQVQNELATQVLTQISQYRKSRGLNTLRTQPALQRAATQRANELFTKFSHTRPNGRSGLSAPTDYGYKGITFVENLGYTYYGQSLEWYRVNGAQKIMQGWKNSPGHNKNLLNRQPTEGAVGISFKQVGPDRYDMTFSYLGGLQKNEYKK
ncbi:MULTISPECIES: CAP domain-containing protein [Enterococcus]|uniref:SCP domain-containing protein n=3 Tax=Enterococcus TaxID=1350 RepID=S0PG38_9ENTE|nr:CAP domain-containing protein [Enterococcus sulfureus]EOT48736.1 hypothetical protein OMY_00692 [Enterococcus sulfureus ATCC 49903]EOT87628.1 hypothetical protein I573_00685 [Enterococcus sulfureus ATCC 49903]